MTFESANLDIEYKIIQLDSLIKWCSNHSDLCAEIEKIMSLHRNNEQFEIEQFLKENQFDCCPLVGKVIILIDKHSHSNQVIAIARCNATKIINGLYVYYISAVHVREGYRGKHLCYRMLKLLIDSNAPAIYELDVAIDNKPAITCYKNLGFTIIDKHFIYNKQEYLMQLSTV